MANDIIAESQTQRTIDTLMRGEADSKSQQIALASLLIAVTKQNEELASIRNTLWSKDDVEKYVDDRHSLHCANCPAKKYVDSLNAPGTRKKEKPWYLELITSESLRYFILVLILVWTVVAMRTTSEETAAVMENVQQTLTGGQVK